MENTTPGKAAVSQHAIVLFDGECNLCNGAVQFIIKRDPAGYFRFCSMQSETGRHLMLQYGMDPNEMETFALLHHNHCFTRSGAALRIASRLAGAWPLLGLFLAVPGPLRNWCYDFIARNRYRWFGKNPSCMLPTRDLRQRFIDQVAQPSLKALVENG